MSVLIKAIALPAVVIFTVVTGAGAACYPSSHPVTTSAVTVSQTDIDARLARSDFQTLSNDLGLGEASRLRLAELWERRNAQRAEIDARHTAAVDKLESMLAGNATIGELNSQIGVIDAIEQEKRELSRIILNEIKLAIGVEKTAQFIVLTKGTGQEAFGGGLTSEVVISSDAAVSTPESTLEATTSYFPVSRGGMEANVSSGTSPNPTAYH